MDHDDEAAGEHAAGALASMADDDDGFDLTESFRVAFAEYCAGAGFAAHGVLRMTAAQLAALAEDMFLSGVDAMLRGLGR